MPDFENHPVALPAKSFSAGRVNRWLLAAVVALNAFAVAVGLHVTDQSRRYEVERVAATTTSIVHVLAKNISGSTLNRHAVFRIVL
jgi:hypothetical protein